MLKSATCVGRYKYVYEDAKGKGKKLLYILYESVVTPDPLRFPEDRIQADSSSSSRSNCSADRSRSLSE